ncbi:MAG: type II toxin-antitoxin system VapC family toxin [Treponema sp.]|jgi:PIN domain nuclease of toxin-antitoxin system|nr:type II toxin-antitoxin system VapC family toxin [Treponema sp.]
MKYLLDTHTFIWSIMDSSKLSEKVRTIIENPNNEIFVSGITFWEIAIKTQIGKMKFENFNILHLPNIATQYGFSIFTPSAYDYVTYNELPLVESHKDPFDRMLIHSALKNNLILLSKDESFAHYEEFGLQLLW